jgi:AcrR family transcriptional regulator
MTTPDPPPAAPAGRRKRSDARRNQQTLLDAAAAVFVRSGVEAPVRDIAAEAGVGMGTIHRHFPTRADLVVAVFRYQLDALAAATTSPEAGGTPDDALRRRLAQTVRWPSPM